MSKSFRKSAVLCLFVVCLTTSAFGASRDGGEPDGFFKALKHKIVHILDLIDVVYPKP